MMRDPISLITVAAMLLSSAQGFTVGSVQAAFGAPKMVKSPTAARLPDARMTEKSGGKRLRRDQRSLLFMGWGSDPIWSDAKVTESKLACPSGKSVLVSVAVPPETAKDYTVPGQYVQIRADEEDEKPVFMAISSPPDPENASFQFLVKKTTNNLLSEAKAGTAIQISQVLGSGYAMEENLEGYKYDFPTQNVLLFAAGSGIAPLAAVVESGQLNVKGGGRTARLYYGEQTADDLCLTDRFAAWEEAGCEVVPVLSQPDDSWQGRTGYVQNALEEDGIAIPRNSGALLCGMKGMTEAVKELLLAAGVFEGRVLFNF